MQAAQFIHGNRLEALADRLIDDLHAQDAGDPMCTRSVVVAHPALGRWLQERIADRCGIAANIRFPLPSSFAWGVLRELGGTLAPESAFSREALAWRIFKALPGLATQPGFDRVRRHLADDTDARQRYELAVLLARCFDEYSMARPDWLRAWTSQRLLLDDADERWQSALWRVLVSGVKEPDRASLMHRALTMLDSGAALPASLEHGVAVFGASHLPPLLLEFFLALARHAPLHFYQPNPCLDYWGDIVSEREISRRRQLWAKHGRGDASSYLEVGHPLLAAWGSLGREHLKAIHAPELVIHDDDAFALPDASRLLGWVQHGILLLDPAHAEPPEDEARPSIRVHACPTRQREVEVLRDEILGLFETLDGLMPHDIVVMSPQIEDYAAAIKAVFGEDDDALAIPYGIGDVALRALHPLIDAFARVLALAESRMAVSEVLGILTEPSIARRQGLHGEAQDWLRSWIGESAIRWGLDDAFRAELGAAALDENTWRFGFNRLLLGYALGDEEAMLSDVVPVANVEGSAAQWLGRLCAFIDAMHRIRKELTQVRSAQAWKLWLMEWLELLLDTESTDAGERAAVRDLREAIAALGNDAGRWLGDEPIEFAVLRDALEDAIGEPRKARAGRFGVTFCGMVPMRNVPHRVVCLLGLDAARFPRKQAAAGLNLMRKHPRPGDRSIREDDRFLFLECLVAARDVFHLSHVSSAADGSDADPPSPVIDELLGFLSSAYGPGRWPQMRKRIVLTHPLQAYAPACFQADAAVPSHDRLWLQAAQALQAPWQEPPAFAEIKTGVACVPESVVDIDIDDVLRWMRHPIRTWFRQQLPIHLSEAQADEDIEAFEFDHLSRYQLSDRLLGPLAGRPDLHRVQREGKFPLGPVGAKIWDTLGEELATLEQAITELPGGKDSALEVEARFLDFPEIGVRLGGSIRHLRGSDAGPTGMLLVRPGRIRSVDIARIAFERALLPPSQAARPSASVLGFGEGRAVVCYTLAEFANEREWIEKLLGWYMRGMRQPVHAFPNCARAFAEAWVKGKGASPSQAAEKAWLEGEYPEGIDAFNALISRHRGEAVLDEQFEAFASEVYVPLHRMLAKVKS